MQFRNDIQGLRAIAFLLVFIFHLNSHWLSGGFLGVDLFFVISGYLMTTITINDIERNKFSFTTFFEKRFKRILPAYLFFLLIISILGSFIFIYTDIYKLKLSIIKAIKFISNLYFSTGDSYFGAKLSENPLLHTWSLSIEIQFYLILPFVLVFFKKHLLPIFVTLIIIITAYSTYEIFFTDNQQKIYFSLISRIPEFLIGSVYSIVFKNGLDFSRQKNNIIAVCSFLALIICSFYYTEETPFPGVLALIPCIAGANILVLKNNTISDILSNKVLVYIGELSYSLYLWHWGIIALIRYINGVYDLTPAEVVFIIFSTFAISWFSYDFLENRFRKTKNTVFLLIFIPIYLGIYVFVMKMEKITEYKKLPDTYTKPVFGMSSHGTKNIEKFGDKSKNDSIILIGDSNALVLKAFLDQIGKKHHFSFRTLTCDTYPAIKGIKQEEIPVEKMKFYNLSQELIIPTQKMIDESKIIIINSAGFERLPSMKTSLENLAKNLRKDQRLVLINTFHSLNRHPLRSYDTPLPIGRELKLEHSDENKKILEEIAKKYENVYIYDVSKSKIFNNTPGYINDTIAYYDAGHLNLYGSRKLADDLGSDFITFLNKIKQ